MAGVALSDETRRRVEMLFPGDDVLTATELLVNDCGSNLPFLENESPKSLERFRFAALKLSKGRLDMLIEAVCLAQEDYRDLLMAAGFGEDVHAHEQWEPGKPGCREQR